MGGEREEEKEEEKEREEREGDLVTDIVKFICNKSAPSVCKQQIFRHPPPAHTCRTFNCCWVASLERMSSLSSFSNSAFTFSTPPDCSDIMHIC